MEEKKKYERKDITHATYRKVLDYIQKNQPIKNKSDIMTYGRVDYISVNIALGKLREENKLDESEGTIKLKNGN